MLHSNVIDGRTSTQGAQVCIETTRVVYQMSSESQKFVRQARRSIIACACVCVEGDGWWGMGGGRGV